MDAAESRSRDKRGLLIVTLLTVAAFGPYVGGGLRTEQAAVYAVAAVALALTVPLMRPSPTVAALLLAWLTYALVGAVGAAWPPYNDTLWERGNLVSGMDNLILPLAAVSIVLGLLAWGADPRELTRRAAGATVVMTLVNTAAARAQAGGADWSAFWSTDAGSVAANSIANGRYTGLINQPAEAGLIYGIALLSVLYLFRDRPKLMLALAAVTVYGGAMSVSKVFLLVALPIALWLALRMTGRRSERVALVLAGMTVFYLLLRFGALPEFAGADQLRQLLPGVGQESLVERLSAGRYGEDAALLPMVSAVLDNQPVFGFGAGGLAVPFDNGWVEALMVAGLVGVVCYTLALLIAARSWQTMVRSPERTFLGSLVVLLIGASAGIPALTANRAATLVWLLLTLLMMAGRRSRRDEATGLELGARSPATSLTRGRSGQPSY